MIKITSTKGRHCPRLFCDECSGEITDYKMALAVWSKDGPVRYIHKRRCDRDDFEFSSELGQHLMYVLANVGLDNIEEIAEVTEHAVSLSHLFD